MVSQFARRFSVFPLPLVHTLVERKETGGHFSRLFEGAGFVEFLFVNDSKLFEGLVGNFHFEHTNIA